MDAIPYIKKPADFSDGEPDGSDGMVSIHDMTANTDGILDFLQEFKQNVQVGTDIFTVGEANGVQPEDLPAWVGENGVFDMIFEFNHFFEPELPGEEKQWTLTDLKRALSASQHATAENGWYPIYFENHDKPRSISYYFPQDADRILAGRAMGTVLLTLRGTPFIYEGEELGYVNVAWPSIDCYNDLDSYSQYQSLLDDGYSEEEALEYIHQNSRDNARTPMQWDGEVNAGFTTGEPWLPVHDEYPVENVVYEEKISSSVLQWYYTLVDFRQNHSALIDGDYTEIDSSSEQIYAFIRENGDEQLAVAVNFTGEDAVLDLSECGIKDGADADILLSSYSQISDIAASADVLRPYEAIVVRIR